MKATSVSASWSVRAGRRLAILMIFGQGFSAVPASQATQLTAGDFYGNDPAKPLSKMELVLYPRDSFETCEVTVVVCKVDNSNGNLTHLTSCRFQAEILGPQDRLALGHEALPVLARTTTLPMPPAAGELLFVGVEFDTLAGCLPAFYLLPFGEGSWFVGGPVDPAAGAQARPHLTLERFEEVLLGLPVGAEMDLPCGNTHIRLQGGPKI